VLQCLHKDGKKKTIRNLDKKRNFYMTQRSIHAGSNPNIIIKVGGSVVVKGQEGDLITAETRDKWGLAIEKRPESEIGRARAAVGEHVLFDVRIKRPGANTNEVIEIKLGGSGEVTVPVGSNLKVYAGKDIDVQGINGVVDAFSGSKTDLKDVYCLGIASAGGKMNLDCQTTLETNVEFKAGSDLRFYIHDLSNAHIQVKDLGGYWQARMGNGEKSVYLKCGGDVTIVTDQPVEALPPNYVLGKIEKPPVS
jgi:hypothetical protein